VSYLGRLRLTRATNEPTRDPAATISAVKPLRSWPFKVRSYPAKSAPAATRKPNTGPAYDWNVWPPTSFLVLTCRSLASFSAIARIRLPLPGTASSYPLNSSADGIGPDTAVTCWCPTMTARSWLWRFIFVTPWGSGCWVCGCLLYLELIKLSHRTSNVVANSHPVATNSSSIDRRAIIDEFVGHERIGRSKQRERVSHLEHEIDRWIARPRLFHRFNPTDNQHTPSNTFKHFHVFLSAFSRFSAFFGAFLWSLMVSCRSTLFHPVPFGALSPPINSSGRCSRNQAQSQGLGPSTNSSKVIGGFFGGCETKSGRFAMNHACTQRSSTFDRVRPSSEASFSNASISSGSILRLMNSLLFGDCGRGIPQFSVEVSPKHTEKS
jgi:hypothetical protein